MRLQVDQDGHGSSLRRTKRLQVKREDPSDSESVAVKLLAGRKRERSSVAKRRSSWKQKISGRVVNHRVGKRARKNAEAVGCLLKSTASPRRALVESLVARIVDRRLAQSRSPKVYLRAMVRRMGRQRGKDERYQEYCNVDDEAIVQQFLT